ncbi:hypothetical protein L3N51_01921 [Metallosphaera sp. J1]|uniref:tetratricopeptide repeat protein n=1 Tax=Metallosphaera javensis (ex Hofmann et al. 2022) TaxID=99938 RepID=UPI001EDF4210|nr:hypothetical protein [Metallosphaera javensis (ex Hofmann et al. 2022)]MCG3109626.1 hypothetical protein [Metallosphaera javensis (ex Hofmann et al. 2022)]
MNRDQIALINAFMDLEPVFSEPLIASGKILCSNGHINEALHLFRRALVIDPDSEEALLDMNLCLNENRRENEQVHTNDWIKRLMKLHSLNSLITWISQNYKNSNFSTEFLRLLDLQIEKTRNTDEYPLLLLFKGQFLLNQSYLRLVDRDYLREAERYFEMVIDQGIKEISTRAWRAMAEINFLLVREDLALEYSLKALDELYSYTFLTRAVILWRLGNKSEAIEYVNDGIRIRSRNYQVTTVDEEVRSYIAEALDNLQESGRQDFRTEMRKWELSSYYLGYCPKHRELKPYFTVQKRGGSKSLKVTHYVPGKGERIEHR